MLSVFVWRVHRFSAWRLHIRSGVVLQHCPTRTSVGTSRGIWGETSCFVHTNKRISLWLYYSMEMKSKVKIALLISWRRFRIRERGSSSTWWSQQQTEVYVHSGLQPCECFSHLMPSGWKLDSSTENLLLLIAGEPALMIQTSWCSFSVQQEDL